MARTNYKFEKRRRELAKKKKKEEKQQRKDEKAKNESEAEGQAGAELPEANQE